MNKSIEVKTLFINLIVVTMNIIASGSLIQKTETVIQKKLPSLPLTIVNWFRDLIFRLNI